MHSFFGRPPLPFSFRARLYAKLIDAEAGQYALFDCVDADFFDSASRDADGKLSAEHWGDMIDRAQIFAVEVNPRSEPGSAAEAWLKENDVESISEWSELFLSLSDGGPAEVYNNISGVPRRAVLGVEPATKEIALALRQAVDLKNDEVDDTVVTNALPAGVIEQIFVLDVGQGAANALVDDNNDVVAYVDLGAGILKNTKTWPSPPMQICLAKTPTVILTHWHYDHFEAANKFSSAQSLVWIAPNQVLGPGPQSAMAKALRGTGGLRVWRGAKGAVLKRGSIEIERCRGTGSQNRDGIAVWVHGPNREDPILLPGDAGYSDIGSAGTRGVTALVVAHHGGRAAGTPPKPGTRLAFSYGHGNNHGHPLSGSIASLGKSGWTVGHPHAPVDERRTEDRKTAAGAVSTGGLGLGHIRLDWSGGTGSAHTCACGCTLDPTQ